MFYKFSIEKNNIIYEYGVVLLEDDGVRMFPIEENNPFAQEYLSWIEEGNIPKPWNPEEDN